ncbi:MAG: GGDEF domain-containing protein, partial [Myxococcota bacterium]
TTDGLTGLTNHRQFQLAFDEMLARSQRYGRKMSLILTDIDHFKSINDTYGHPVGDLVLKRVARLLEEGARKTDVVARYGGEEFAVLMEETDTDDAYSIAERIRESIQAETFRSENGSFQCTLSLGVTTYPEDGATKAEIIERADQNLYEAKHGGRNRTVVSQSRRPRVAS